MAQKQCFLTLYPKDTVTSINGTTITPTAVEDMPATFTYLAEDLYWCTQPGGNADYAVLVSTTTHAAISLAGSHAAGGSFNLTSTGFVGQHPERPMRS